MFMMWFQANQSNDIALRQGELCLSYQQMNEQVQVRAAWLNKQGVKRLALALDNGIEWVLFDLACQAANVVCIPVPSFFSEAQKAHLMQHSQVNVCVQGSKASGGKPSPFADVYYLECQTNTAPLLPIGTSKVTFTSGSTGNPKGVCLSLDSQLQAAKALIQRIGLSEVKHLCLLPLATLLENIAGVYAPLMVGGTVVLCDDQQRGFEGSRLVNPQAMLATLSQEQPETLILVPELLQLLVHGCRSGWQPPASLKFVAVGGAHVAPPLLKAASECGLPVFQGYGLSECVSVVALNTPNEQRIDSAGRVLEHNQVEIQDHELCVSGNVFLGYMNEPHSWYPTVVKTGDRVRLSDHHLYVEGRFKNTLINSFGRNISPEWIEAELIATGCFQRAVVVGDEQPVCGAFLQPIHSDISDEKLALVIAQLNRKLPDYAQLKCWATLATNQWTQPGLYTQNGKLIRAQFVQQFAEQIQQLFTPIALADKVEEQYDAIL